MNRHEKPQSPVTIPIIYLVTEKTRQPITGPVKLSITMKQFIEIKQQTVTAILSGAVEREKGMFKYQLKEQDVLLRRDTINAESENGRRLKRNITYTPVIFSPKTGCSSLDSQNLI